MMPIGCQLVVSYITFIVSNIVPLTAFEIFDVQVCDLDLGSSRSSKVKGHGVSRQSRQGQCHILLSLTPSWYFRRLRDI